MDASSLNVEYYADEQLTSCLGRITFDASSQHELQGGVLTLSNVKEVIKGKNKDTYALKHSDAQALEWWNETLTLAQQARPLLPPSN